MRRDRPAPPLAAVLAAALAGLVSPGLTACGDGAGPATPDAAIPVDAIDAPVLPAGCDYAELRDLTNDDVSSSAGTPEQTGLTFGSHVTVCGTLDHGHFDGDITADVDGFVVTVMTDADLLIRLHGPGIEVPELVGVDIYGGPTLTQLIGSITVYGTHGVTAVRLAAGTYELTPFALNSVALTASIPYRLELDLDAPDTRCPEQTTGGYAEANDGASNDGNDVVRLPMGSPPMLTVSGADAPEPTQLVVDAASYRVTGVAADIATADNYEDVDTFAFTTGATTNELDVRLTWPGGTTNLDYLLFEQNDPTPLLRANAASTQGPERRVFSIKPNAAYWLLIGARVGSTGLPATYAATMCGATFAP